MLRFMPLVLALLLAAITDFPDAGAVAMAGVALFRAPNRKQDASVDDTGFGLLEYAARPHILTNELGVIRAANAAARAFAAEIDAPCAVGAHVRMLFAADPEAEQKIYRAVRGASDDKRSTAEFSAIGDGVSVSAQLSQTVAQDCFLWSLSLSDDPTDGASPVDQMAVLGDAPIGYFSADRGGKIISMNDTLATWIGHDRDAPDAGSVVLSDILTDGARRLSPALAKLDEVITEAAALRGPDGNPVQVNVVQSLIATDDGESVTRSFVFLDPPKADLDVGTTTGARLVRFLDDAPVAVALTTTDGTIVEANDMLVEMSGGNARVNTDVAVAVRKEDRHEVAERIADVVAGADSKQPLEVKLIGDDGAEHEARYHVHTITTDRGEMLLNYLIDVTEMKKIENEFAQVQKMQAVGQLAGGIAHDVNNVLTAIRGHCDLLMLRHHEGDPDFEYLNQIRSQTGRAAAVISQLLAYSRRQTMRREITQLTDTLDDMQFMLKHLTTERVKFRVQHARELGLVRIDRSEFQRVIVNLAVNASHAMPGGGDIIMRTSNVDAADPLVADYDVMAPGRYVQIEVSDNGEGIAPENLGKIFEPFFTTKGQGQGTGLGLSTVYGIIKQMNGFIFCDSEVGTGTTFRIFLPRYEGTVPSEEPVVAKKAPTAKPRDLSGSGCILLVEDEDAVRSFAVRALELRGYKVLAAAGGEEALEIVKEDPDAIDLVVSDVIMPGMTGPEMMREVRELRDDVLFIFISGYAEDAFRDEMLEDENFRFLAKPFSLNDLATKVKEALEE